MSNSYIHIRTHIYNVYNYYLLLYIYNSVNSPHIIYVMLLTRARSRKAVR